MTETRDRDLGPRIAVVIGGTSLGVVLLAGAIGILLQQRPPAPVEPDITVSAQFVELPSPEPSPAETPAFTPEARPQPPQPVPPPPAPEPALPLPPPTPPLAHEPPPMPRPPAAEPPVSAPEPEPAPQPQALPQSEPPPPPREKPEPVRQTKIKTVHHVPARPLPPQPAAPEAPSAAAPPPVTATQSTSPVAPSPAPVRADGPSGGTSGARAIIQPKPEIPPELRYQTINLVAVVHFVIAADGSATASLEQPTPDPRLNRVLLDAFKRWRFFPALDHGKPVASTLTLRVPIVVD